MFIWFALVLFAIGSWNIYQNRLTLENCVKVEGKLAEIRHYPAFTGSGSISYPVFEYTVGGRKYREEYMYSASGRSRMEAAAGKPEMPEGRVKDFILKAAQTQPEYNVGGIYTLVVSRDHPQWFYIENQSVVLLEMKWFIMGGVILIFDLLYNLLAAFLGR